ncbi:MAG: NAD(P)-dependent oxidoreductase [Rhodobacter sp.]|nr:NAD(P)-dependent oxidoreductase [Rhodobacter sp.]
MRKARVAGSGIWRASMGVDTGKVRIAVLGTGLMGGPMARNLLKAGFPVAVWNRTRAKADALSGEGAEVADTAAQAVADADFVISMLSDGPAVLEMVTAVCDGLRSGAVWIDMSSTKPSEARAQARLLAASGHAHLDAPVSGGTRGAQDASLAIMVGGEADVFARAEPVLRALGRPVHVGPSGSGQLAKLANQGIVAVTIGAVAEAMLLLQKGGADPAAVRAALKGGFADSTILQQHGERMTTGNFVPGGLSKFQLKDLRNVMAEAEGLGLSLPMIEDVTARFQTFCDLLDGAEKDHSGLYLELLHRNGTET